MASRAWSGRAGNKLNNNTITMNSEKRLRKFIDEETVHEKIRQTVKLPAGVQEYVITTHYLKEVAGFCTMSTRHGGLAGAVELTRLNRDVVVENVALIKQVGFIPSWQPLCLRSDHGDIVGTPSVRLYQIGGKGYQSAAIEFWLKAGEDYVQINADIADLPTPWRVHSVIHRYSQETGEPTSYSADEPAGLKGGQLYRQGLGNWNYYKYWRTFEEFVHDCQLIIK